MKLGLRYIIWGFVFIPTIGLAGKCVLPAYKADYTAYIKGAKAGSMAVALSYTRNTYKYISKTKIHYLLYHDDLFQGVRGYIRDNKLVPIRYYYGAKTQGSNRSHSIKKGIYDFMTYKLQLRRELLAGESTFSFPVYFSKKEARLNFNVIQRDYSLNTKLGPLKTVIVVGVTPNGATTTYWLSKKYNYLIVKTETRRGAKALGSMRIERYQEKQGGACPIKALRLSGEISGELRLKGASTPKALDSVVKPRNKEALELEFF